MTIGSVAGPSIDPPLDEEILDVLGVDDYLSRVYYKPDGAGVGLYMGYYGSQRQGDTIHSPQNCLPGAGWEPVTKAALTLPTSTAPAGTSPSTATSFRRASIDRSFCIGTTAAAASSPASTGASAYLINDAIRSESHRRRARARDRADPASAPKTTAPPQNSSPKNSCACCSRISRLISPTESPAYHAIVRGIRKRVHLSQLSRVTALRRYLVETLSHRSDD